MNFSFFHTVCVGWRNFFWLIFFVKSTLNRCIHEIFGQKRVSENSCIFHTVCYCEDKVWKLWKVHVKICYKFTKYFQDSNFIVLAHLPLVLTETEVLNWHNVSQRHPVNPKAWSYVHVMVSSAIGSFLLIKIGWTAQPGFEKINKLRLMQSKMNVTHAVSYIPEKLQFCIWLKLDHLYMCPLEK